MDQSTSAGGIIVNSRGEIILAEQAGPSWSLPKGHVEEGETPLAAALREVREEAGVEDARYQGSLPAYSRTNLFDPGEMKTIYPFLFSSDTTELHPTDPAHHHAEWMTVDRAIGLLAHPADRALLDAVRPRIESLANSLQHDAAEAEIS